MPYRITKAERKKRYLFPSGVAREDSDDELGLEDYPWEWIYSSVEDRENGRPEIVGAQMGNFQCKLGDCVLLKAEGANEAWIGLICEFQHDEEEDQKAANFMWFSTEREIRNEQKKRTDSLPNEVYITPSWDLNPLASINGKATIVSPATFQDRYPAGKIQRSSADHGKVFICRRGCNTRTATYTEEFVWENVYRGAEDIAALIERIKGQTRATRKKKREQTYREDDLFDWKPTKGAETPKPQARERKHSRPRFHSLKASLVHTKPLHRLKKPLPLSQIARTTLHVSTVPTSLPCRKEEFATVYNHLEAAISAGSGSCIYISGTPGTGKTATVREVVAQLNASVSAEELDDFIFVEINGMKLTDPHQSYSLLWEALRGERVSPAYALGLLEREFDHPSPRRVPCVVLMDELDQLVTKNQSVMYNFFNWPGLRHSRLIILAVANTMDLPERTLSNKISSRLGLTRITFPGYTHEQLMTIIQSRLTSASSHIVDSDAVQFASRKVAAVSGDARRALDICRRAVEIAEAEVSDVEPNALATPSKRRKLEESNGLSEKKRGKVSIATIKQAINEATSSPLQQYLKALPLSSKVLLAAILARVQRSGVGECAMGDVVEEAKHLCVMATEISIIQGTLLTDAALKLRVSGGSIRTPTKNIKSAAAGVPRILGMGNAASDLAAAGVVSLEGGIGRKGDRVGRLRLSVGEEEIRLALRDDEQLRGIGVAS